MGDLLSGLESFGLGGLEGMNLFEEKKAPGEAVKEAPVITEKDFLLDKTTECPVCDEKFMTRAVKGGKAKLLSQDRDLRPRHEGIDITKYDVIMCPYCGYAALGRYFPNILDSQRKKVREKITASFKPQGVKPPETYTYDEALDRYKMALVNAIVKGAKASEKAYICLKSAWVVRGKAEEMGPDDPQYAAAKAMEAEYQKNAYEGFCSAVETESFPMCGMDETTVDYMIAVLAFETDHLDVCSKMIAKVLQSPTANPRTKDKVRFLKEEVLNKLKAKG